MIAEIMHKIYVMFLAEKTRRKEKYPCLKARVLNFISQGDQGKNIYRGGAAPPYQYDVIIIHFLAQYVNMVLTSYKVLCDKL